jgi:hypothetical protein
MVERQCALVHILMQPALTAGNGALSVLAMDKSSVLLWPSSPAPCVGQQLCHLVIIWQGYQLAIAIHR